MVQDKKRKEDMDFREKESEYTFGANLNEVVADALEAFNPSSYTDCHSYFCAVLCFVNCDFGVENLTKDEWNFVYEAARTKFVASEEKKNALVEEEKALIKKIHDTESYVYSLYNDLDKLYDQMAEIGIY